MLRERHHDPVTSLFFAEDSYTVEIRVVWENEEDTHMLNRALLIIVIICILTITASCFPPVVGVSSEKKPIAIIFQTQRFISENYAIRYTVYVDGFVKYIKGACHSSMNFRTQITQDFLLENQVEGTANLSPKDLKKLNVLVNKVKSSCLPLKNYDYSNFIKKNQYTLHPKPPVFELLFCDPNLYWSMDDRFETDDILAIRRFLDKKIVY